MEKEGKGWRKAREEMEPKEFKGVEKEEERERREVSSAGLCGWLCAPVLLGGCGWLNKQS